MLSADRIGHMGAAFAGGLWRAGGGVLVRLVFHFGVQFRSEKNRQGGDDKTT